MVIEFKLPDVGEGVAEGEVSKWLVRKGDSVKEYQPLVEIITEKVTVELPSPTDGVIIELSADEGEVVKVGQTLVIIETKDVSKPIPETEGISIKASSTNTATLENEDLVGPTKVLATPSVRKLAKQMNVDLSMVQGTGSGGRIVEGDVRMHASSQSKSDARPSGQEERIPISGVKRTTVERLSRSWKNIVQATCLEDVDMTNVLALRDSMKEREEQVELRLTVLHFIIKAVASSLKIHSKINSSLDDEGNDIILKKYYNIGIAIDTEQGLVVPVLMDVDKKDIFQIAKEVQDVTRRAKDGMLKLEEIQGGTFTITNIGSIGGIASTPIVNYPEAAILGVHRIEKKPVVWEGSISARDRVCIAISFDHRVIDGADAVRFLNTVKRFLEQAEDRV